MGWVALGLFVGLWAATALVLWVAIGDAEDPIPDWPYYLAVLLPIVGAVAFGTRGPAIVGSRAGRWLLIATALAPFAAVARLVAWAVS